MEVSCSTTSQHEYAWKPGILQSSLLVLFRLLRTEVAADRFLNYHFFSTPPQWPEQLLPCCSLAVAFLHTVACFVFARSCHSQPVSTGPWEIYTQPPVWGEAVKWAGDMQAHAHIFGKFYVFVCQCMSAASQKFLYILSLSFSGQISSLTYEKCCLRV